MEIIIVSLIAIVGWAAKHINLRKSSNFIDLDNKKAILIDKTFSLLILLFLIFVISFRNYNAYVDTHTYTQIFYAIKKFGFLDYSGTFPKNRFHTEIGYNAVAYAFSIFKTPLPLNIFYASLTYSLMYKFISKYSKQYIFSVLIVFSMYFLYTANIVRQMVAASILLIALDKFLEKKSWLGIILVLLATLFHKTAIMFIFVFFFRYISVPRKFRRYLFLIIALGLLAFAGGHILSNTKLHRYLNYFPRYNGFHKQKFAYLFFDFILILLLWPFRKSNEGRISMWVSSLSLVANALSLRLLLMSRIAIFFNIFSIAFVPRYLEKNAITKGNTTYKFVVLFVYIVYFFGKFFLSKSLSTWFPWKYAFDLLRYAT